MRRAGGTCHGPREGAGSARALKASRRAHVPGRDVWVAVGEVEFEVLTVQDSTFSVVREEHVRKVGNVAHIPVAHRTVQRNRSRLIGETV